MFGVFHRIVPSRRLFSRNFASWKFSVAWQSFLNSNRVSKELFGSCVVFDKVFILYRKD